MQAKRADKNIGNKSQRGSTIAVLEKNLISGRDFGKLILNGESINGEGPECNWHSYLFQNQIER
jgi:hypothetical protein